MSCRVHFVFLPYQQLPIRESEKTPVDASRSYATITDNLALRLGEEEHHEEEVGGCEYGEEPEYPPPAKGIGDAAADDRAKADGKVDPALMLA